MALVEHRAAVAAALVRAARARGGGAVRYVEIIGELRAHEAYAATKPLLVELVLEDFAIDPRVPVVATSAGIFGQLETLYVVTSDRRARPRGTSQPVSRAPSKGGPRPVGDPGAGCRRTPRSGVLSLTE